MQHLWESLLFLVILLGPLPLCGSVLLITEGNDTKPRLSHCVLVAITFWCGIQVSLGLVLGMAQHLTLGPVLVFETCLFLVGACLLVLLRRRIAFSFRDLLVSGLRLTNLEILVLGTIGLVGLALLWQLATTPITEYDSVAFHLPIVATWYQTGSLSIADYFARLSRYPYDWEVLCLLFVLPFGEDLLVAFPNLVAWTLMGLSVYLLSTRMGAKRLPGMAAAALILTMPMMLEHVNTIHIDLPFAAFFMASVYFGIVACERARFWSSLPPFLIAFGLFVGSKTSSLPYAFVLIVVLGALWAISRPRRGVSPTPRPVVPDRYTRLLTLGAVLGFLLVAGYWYGYNFVRDGNPLGGYLGVQIGGLTILQAKWDLGVGDVRMTTLAALFRLTSRTDWGILLEQLWINWNVPFVAMALLAAPVLPIHLAGRGQINKTHLLSLCTLLVATGALYWCTPFSAAGVPNPGEITPWMGQALRYAFPFVGLLGVAAAVGASSVGLPNEVPAAIALIGGVSTAPWSEIPVAGIILLSGWGLFVLAGRLRSVIRVLQVPRLLGWSVLALVLFGVLALASFEARQQREVQRRVVYEGIGEYIAANVAPDEKIAAALTHRGYALFGPDLTTRVLYLPVDAARQAEWMDLLRNNDLAQALALLRSEGISVLAIGPLAEDWIALPEVKQLVDWLDDPNGPFTRVFGDDASNVPTLYRLKDSQNVGRLP